MKLLDALTLALVVVLIGVSFLNPAGLVVGLVLAAVVVLARYGIPYALRLEESRRMGEKARGDGWRARMRDSDSDGDGRGWRR